MSNIASLKRAAEQHISVNAQYLLGLMYLYGQDEQGEGKDKAKAQKWLAKAAAQKHALAQARLERLADGSDKNHNPADLQQAAQQGDSHAQFDLSRLYYYGWAVKQDFVPCFNGLQSAAEQGCPYAQYLFGGMYWYGEGVAENTDEGFKWMLKAAEQGYAHAQFFVADRYLYDRRVGIDTSKALKWANKAVQQGYSQAQSLLGLMYEQAWGVQKNLKQAMALYRQAAEQGNLQAYDRIANLYKNRLDDPNEALRWYQKAAERGYSLSQYSLAKMLKYADGIPHDYAKACYWFEKAAEQGDEMAARNLAEHYAIGSGVEIDERKASYWYLHAAKLGDDQAQYQIGHRYEYGNGIEKDFKQAEYWYRQGAKQNNYDCKEKIKDIRSFKRYLKAAKNGDAEAQYILASRYIIGLGTGQNPEQALHWYLCAAELGHAAACYQLGELYEEGDGVEKDETAALNWYRQAVALGSKEAAKRLAALDALQQLESGMTQGDPEAHYQLGLRYEDGEGVPRNHEQAVQHYRMAAELGHGEALFALGRLHERGGWFGFKINDSEAVPWYEKAAQQGHGEAQYRLGIIYDSSEKKRGVAKDDSKAVHYYQQAATQGHAQAQYALGRLYAKGVGVAKDEARALHWYEQAAQQDHQDAKRRIEDLKRLLALSTSREDDIDAQYQLGLTYDYGRGVERDFVRAVKHYRNAAERGHTDAQYEMGNMCAYAQGTAHSESEAFNWYLKAALQGHKDAQAMLRNIQAFHKTAEAAVQGNAAAQYELSVIYANGDMRPIREDKARGFQWLLQSAENGYAEAQFGLGRSYEEGELVEKDPAKALYWLNQSAKAGNQGAIDHLRNMEQSQPLRQQAEAGDLEAQFRLAWLYQHGSGMEYNHVKAAHWYEQAAQQGHADAQYQLGRIYKDGIGGMTRNIDLALEWFKKAAAQKHPLAADFIVITHYNQAQGNYDKPKSTETLPPNSPIKTEATPPKSPLWYSAEQLPLLKKALHAKPSAAPPQIRATQQKALDTVLRCAAKLSGAFADKHVELVKIGMRELRKEADQYDSPDEFRFDHPMFDELSAELRKVRDEEGAFALHCLIDRSQYKIYEWDEPDNTFGVSVHCEA